MARSSAARRARRELVAAGAPTKPADFQPSRRAQDVRASVAEDVTAMRTQIDEHRDHVVAVGISPPKKTDAELASRAAWLPALAHGLADVEQRRRRG